MAKAPTPKVGGHEAAQERIQRARQTFRIDVAGTDVSFTYRPFGVTVRTRAKVREATGMATDEFLFGNGSFDVQTYADMWWISRLEDGENVTRDQVLGEWDEKCEGVSKDDVSEVLVEDATDDPKA